jgi:hypothetical protein
MNQSKLLNLFEALYEDAKNNITLLQMLVTSIDKMSKTIHSMYDTLGIDHDDVAFEQLNAGIEVSRKKIAITQNLVYQVEHPAENEVKDE